MEIKVKSVHGGAGPIEFQAVEPFYREGEIGLTVWDSGGRYFFPWHNLLWFVVEQSEAERKSV